MPSKSPNPIIEASIKPRTCDAPAHAVSSGPWRNHHERHAKRNMTWRLSLALSCLGSRHPDTISPTRPAAGRKLRRRKFPYHRLPRSPSSTADSTRPAARAPDKMENPASALWAEVSQRTDIENIIWELVGLTTIRLCSVAETSWGALGQTIRQSMLRLKIIFDTQSAHFVQHQFPTSGTAADESFLLSKNSCFESAVYLTSLGTRLTPPERCGRQDHALQRALALDAFISSFRVLVLHRDPLRFEQEDLLRERVAQLTEAWTRQQALSPLEDLVLNTIVPATLDELQETDGNSCIQQLGCARFSASSFERGRVSELEPLSRESLAYQEIRRPFAATLHRRH